MDVAISRLARSTVRGIIMPHSPWKAPTHRQVMLIEGCHPAVSRHHRSLNARYVREDEDSKALHDTFCTRETLSTPPSCPVSSCTLTEVCRASFRLVPPTRLPQHFDRTLGSVPRSLSSTHPAHRGSLHGISSTAASRPHSTSLHFPVKRLLAPCL